MQVLKYWFYSMLLFYGDMLYAQELGIGEWRSHDQYNNVNSLFLTGHKLFGTSDYHAFYINTADGEVTRLSKVNTFNEVGISTITQKEEEDLLVVGFKNGNVDVLRDGVTRNIPLLMNSTVSGDKSISKIVLKNDLAYVVTRIGVFVMDLDKNELIESYRVLGPNAEIVDILISEFAKDSLYLQTDFGFIGAPLATTLNLQDFNNWKRIDAPGMFDFLATDDQRLFGSIGKTVYEYISGFWQTMVTSLAPIEKLRVSDGQLVAVHNDSYSIFNDTISTVALVDYDINDIVLLNGETWIADKEKGIVLLKDRTGSGFISNFVKVDNIGRTTSIEDITYILSDTDTTLSILKAGIWTSSVLTGSPSSVSKTTNNKTYITIYDKGLYCLEEEAFVPGPFSTPVQLSSSIVDQSGNLWVSQYDNNVLLKMSPTREWEEYTLTDNGARYIEELLIDGYGLLWGQLSEDRDGVIAFDPVSEQSKWLRKSNSNLPSGSVLDLAIDEEDQIWFATSSGVAFLPFPPSVFDNTVEVFQPIFGNRLLFDEERITAVAVDGGNRKWMATAEGAWLLEDDGDELVTNFNTENSPLPDNTIKTITINQLNGEVFFNTNRGMVSYRSNASKGAVTHAEKLKIFPNPVPPGFSGQVGIYGTAKNAILKVTDSSGNLIKEIRSEGGSSSWDLRDYNGIRVQTGVYLIFSATRDGSDTLVGKFAVVN